MPGIQPCRLTFGGNPKSLARLTWILRRNDVGAALVLPDDACDITMRADGRFDGAGLAVEITYDGTAYAPAASPMREPGRQRLTVRPKALRPVLSGGGECTTVIVTLTAERT